MYKIFRNSHFVFNVITSLFVAIFFMSSDFILSPVNGWADRLVIFAQYGILVLAVFFLIYCLSVFRYLFATVFPCLVFCMSVLAYFRLTLNATLTPLLIDAVVGNSDLRLAVELISFWLILFVLISLIVSIILIRWRFSFVVRHKAVKGVASAAIFLLIINIPSVVRPARMRIPFNIYYTVEEYRDVRGIIQTERPSLANAVRCDSIDQDLIVVFVLGESLRADHLSLNGYHRNTTAKLNELGVISMPFMRSTYTHTSASVPHILTRADQYTKELAHTDRSFIGLFNACGFKTTWIGNQELAKSYTYFAHEADSLIIVNREKSVYTHDKWLDEDLLKPYRFSIDSNVGKKLVVLHMIGSHWWYDSHYPDLYKIYEPIANSRIVSSNSHESMVNSYDNTIHYTDEILSQIIASLKDKNALFIYLSDHGEALGEEGMWLHAVESDVLRNPAFLIWFSETYKSKHPDKVQNLLKNQNKNLSDDLLFHSILDGSGIQSPFLKKEQSVFGYPQ